MFTVRDLALLSSRWSHPASERAPSPQSPALSLFSWLSSPPLLHFPPSILSFVQTQSPPSLFTFSFNLLLPPTLSIAVSYFFPAHLSPCPLPSPQPYFFFLPLRPPSSSVFFSCFILCSRVSKGRKGYKEKL